MKDHELRFSETNSADDSTGRTWGLDGNLFWYVVGGVFAFVVTLLFLFSAMRVSFSGSFATASVPLAVTLIYVFGLRTMRGLGSPSRVSSLARLVSRGLIWADCEALERRRNLGRGTLVVLDAVPGSGASTYEERRAIFEQLIPIDSVFSGDTSRPVPCGSVVLTPTMRADSHADALAFYQRLREANRVLRRNFFEGVVMKRADSIYSVQRRSATEECRGWVKHRFIP